MDIGKLMLSEANKSSVEELCGLNAESNIVFECNDGRISTIMFPSGRKVIS